MKDSTRGFPDVVPHHPLLQEISVVAAERGLLPIYLVGGFVRDALLGRRGPLDLDLVTKDPLALGAVLHLRFEGKEIGLGGRVRRVVFFWKGERVQVDLSPLHSGGITDDLRHRDFTINALAVPVGEEWLIDPTGGLQDLRERRIRMTDPEVFADDPLRLLRSVRLAAQLQFSIEETTAEAVCGRAFLLRTVTAERLREEFFAILNCADGGHWIGVMHQCALLDTLLPETRPMQGCAQGPPHRFDVLTHSLETVRSLDWILRSLSSLVPDEADSLVESLRIEVEGGINREAVLRFVALLHDVGKPDTRSVEDGQIRFLGHAARGGSIVEGICARLRLGSRASAMTVTLVREHLRPLSLRQGGVVTPRARFRFWRNVGHYAVDLLLLSLADIRATWGEEDDNFRDHLRFVQEMFAFRRDRIRPGERPGSPAILVDGHELMARMDLSPGPFVGFLLEWLREEGSLGFFTSKEEALEYLERHLDMLREAFAKGESP